LTCFFRQLTVGSGTNPIRACRKDTAKKGREMKDATGAGLVLSVGAVWSVQGLLIRNIPDAGPWVILFWRSASLRQDGFR